MTGLFVAFEGGEGSGKSTQADRLTYSLIQAGIPAYLTKEPGDSTCGATLRQLLLHSPPGSIPPRAEALLYAADRACHVHDVIRPHLEAGDVVVCDRYEDSSIAYQGFGRSLGPGPIEWLSQWGTDHLHPDLVVLLDIDPRLGLVRAAANGQPDRIEAEPLRFHDQARAGFLARASAEPDRYLVLDTTESPDILATVIFAEVAKRLVQKAGRQPAPVGKVIAMTERSRCKPSP